MFLFIREVYVAYGKNKTDLNTSHVLIYRGATYYLSDSALFKYISCSYLSCWRKHLRDYSKNLNTSHVLIYLGVNKFEAYFDRFKYISCSYLSFV